MIAEERQRARTFRRNDLEKPVLEGDRDLRARGDAQNGPDMSTRTARSASSSARTPSARVDSTLYTIRLPSNHELILGLSLSRSTTPRRRPLTTLSLVPNVAPVHDRARIDITEMNIEGLGRRASADGLGRSRSAPIFS
jgi:hypothetical protein